MQKNYIANQVLRTCDCDMAGDWRPSAVLEAMQETAVAHCDGLGCGRAFTDGLGVAWVLSRSKVALSRVPRLHEAVSVETYPLPPRHLFYPRVNVFRDGEGRQIGLASSLWVLMDLSERRIVQRPEVLSLLPDNADLPLPLALPATVRALPGEPQRRAMTPPYSDFDINGHVNNTRYLDWCCGALGFEAMASGQLAAFDINYDAEIRPDCSIETQLVRDGDRFSFCGFAQERRCFAISGTLTPREK